ncbi:hypothetical protein C0J52_14116 [Blattella germanica]|nr:hypothetical protein C0J52_14116 [Blattella germanica]
MKNQRPRTPTPYSKLTLFMLKIFYYCFCRNICYVIAVYNYIKNKNQGNSVSFIANDNEPLIIQLMSDCSSCPSPSSSSSELDSMLI